MQNLDVIPSAYDIADSAHFFNKSDYCISVHANKETQRTTIKIDKVKYSYLGTVSTIDLGYDTKTTNYFDVEQDVLFSKFDTEKYISNTFEIPVSKKTDVLDIEVDCFNNITDTIAKQANLKDLLTGNNIEKDNKLIQEIRNTNNKDLKKNLTNFCINARFDKTRNKNNISKYTNLVYIDIDYKDNLDIIEQVPKLLKNIQNVAFYKKSAGGKGYTVIIPYLHTLDFEKVWESLEEDFKNLGITIDKATKNTDRVTFYSFDTNYYINEDVVIYNKEKQQEKNIVQYNFTKPSFSTQYRTSNAEYMKQLINYLDNKNTPLDAGNYSDWQKICLALITEFDKEEALNYFINVSKQYKYFDKEEATDFFNEHLKRYKDNNTVTFATIKHLAKKIGFAA